MKSLREMRSNELRWVHPKLLSNVCELRAGDEVCAVAQRKGLCGTEVQIESVDGNWQFARYGLRQQITIMDVSTNTEAATIKHGIRGNAMLLFSDGHEYRWICTSFWRMIWTWTTSEGTPLLHLKRGALVQLEQSAQGLPELTLLTALGWYLHKLQEEDTGTIAASIIPSF